MSGVGTPKTPARIRVRGAITSRLGNLSAPNRSDPNKIRVIALVSISVGSSGVAYRWMGRSTEFQMGDIDRYQYRLRHFLTLFVIGEYPPCRRHLDALNISIVERIVGSAGAAQNIYRVIVPAHQPIGAEVRDLFLDVACDAVRGRHFQPAPRFTALVPGIDLFSLEVRERV